MFPKPKYASVNPDRPAAWACCDRCGFTYQKPSLRWQHEWQGRELVNLRLLVCPACLDKPNPGLKTVNLPADPLPVKDPRPETLPVS